MCAQIFVLTNMQTIIKLWEKKEEKKSKKKKLYQKSNLFFDNINIYSLFHSFRFVIFIFSERLAEQKRKHIQGDDSKANRDKNSERRMHRSNYYKSVIYNKIPSE